MSDVLREALKQCCVSYGLTLAFKTVARTECSVGTFRETGSWRAATSFDGGNVGPGATYALRQFVLCPAALIAQRAETLTEGRAG